MENEQLYTEALELLKQLIAVPSFSKEEDKTATLIESFLSNRGIECKRHLNNVWALNKYFDETKPSILLNSHHDTVRPNKGYTIDPFSPIEENGKLYGLGSNDAGGSLVSLLATFIYFYNQQNLNFNLIIAATAEEEISGLNGIEALLNHASFAIPLLKKGLQFGIVGEPTLMNMAIAEKGLLVLDCTVKGKAGHAAREEGENAIYKAIKDIAWFSSYKFDRISDLIGPVKMTVTIINAGVQHNVVPHLCKFTVDIRLNELYSHEELMTIIKQHVQCEIEARSTRLRSTFIPADHPIIKAGLDLGCTYYGSPTTSDKALLPFPAVKIGPGDSARSHIADEFIYTSEIKDGIAFYIQLLKKIL